MTELNEIENPSEEMPTNDEVTNEIKIESAVEADTEKHHSTEEETAPHESEDLMSKLGFSKKDKHKKELKEAKEKIEELNDKYLRLVAEFDNFRKRNIKERMEWMATAGQDIMVAMLPVLDDFNRASKQMEQATDIHALKEGVQLIHTKFQNILNQKGLKAMKSIGENFNPEFHEAITEIPAPTEELIGKVIDEVESGYYLNEKIIRYAKVVVGK